MGLDKSKSSSRNWPCEIINQTALRTEKNGIEMQESNNLNLHAQKLVSIKRICGVIYFNKSNRQAGSCPINKATKRRSRDTVRPSEDENPAIANKKA